MLRFIRQIRQKLIVQENVKKYILYAIGEIALVMIGILLALQVNNWNEQKKQVDQEVKLLYDLKQEFAINRTELELAISRKEIGLENLKKRMNYIIEKDDKALFDQKFSGGANTFHPSDGVLKTIISTGQITLLQNDSLKYALADWESKVADIQEEENTHLEFMINVLDEYENTKMFKMIGAPEFNSPEYLNWVTSNEPYLRNRIKENINDPVYLSYHQQAYMMLKMAYLEFTDFEKEYSRVEIMISNEISYRRIN